MTIALKPYRLFSGILAFNVVLFLVDPSAAWVALSNSAGFLGNVLLIVPSVMVLVGLFDVWVPRTLVEQNIGNRSGARGVTLALLLGTAAAGPLYAAFPVARSLQLKGARLANLVIFLGAWGSIKIPMLILESGFLGLRFAVLRLALTLPGVIGLGFLMERLLSP